MTEDWTGFFTATAGAGAALAGLIIVAMAANITRILEIPSMTSRAGTTIASLVLIVVTSVAALIPAQRAAYLGVEDLVFALGVLVFAVDSGLRMVRAAPPETKGQARVKAAFGLIQILPFTVGGVVLVSGSSDGLYWVATGMLMVFIGSVANAWVLLVEILR